MDVVRPSGFKLHRERDGSYTYTVSYVERKLVWCGVFESYENLEVLGLFSFGGVSNSGSHVGTSSLVCFITKVLNFCCVSLTLLASGINNSGDGHKCPKPYPFFRSFNSFQIYSPLISRNSSFKIFRIAIPTFMTNVSPSIIKQSHILTVTDIGKASMHRVIIHFPIHRWSGTSSSWKWAYKSGI